MQKEEILTIVKETVDALEGRKRPNLCQLLVGTAAQESNMQYRVQLGNGPARGIWQMEPATARDIFENYLIYRVYVFDSLMHHSKLSFELDFAITMPLDELAIHLRDNDYFACSMARILYRRKRPAIPKFDDIGGLALYWKEHYNTLLGAGKVEEFVAKWNLFELSDLD